MNETLTALDPTARTLNAGDLRAVFLPGRGMLCASLQHRGQELLGRVDDIASFAVAGRTSGIPLLYPWANRLEAARYTTAGREVSLESSPLIAHDDKGLPMHGVPWSRLSWNVTSEGSAMLNARLEWTGAERLAVFPFPHHVEMWVLLDADTLRIETTLVADAASAVPVSFGFHPYFRIPEVSREEWQVKLPAMTRLELDERNIPTGQGVAVAHFDAQVGDRTFDDGFVLDAAPASFSLAGGGRRINVEFLEGYSYAQVFAPGGKDYIAIEPMTAPANALVSGSGLRVVEPGEEFRATFRIRVIEENPARHSIS
jgi:aldose 1-epimerase